MDAVSSLRQEFPALGLTAGFAAPETRALYADLMLLWLEMNRARSANETLIAAARMTWWRDAIDQHSPEGVPLATRLLAYPSLDRAALVQSLTALIDLTLHADPEDRAEADNKAHLVFGQILSSAFGCDATAAGQVMIRLKASLAGAPRDIPINDAGLPKPLRLVAWLADDPARLHYPEAKPMLALSMMMAAFRI